MTATTDNAIHPGEARRVTGVTRGMPASDGAGVRLTRIIGAPGLEMLDPFLLLDCFESDDPDDYVAGFPDHPHRGFETVTYLLAGRMRHRDSAGNEGVIEPGGIQWMTAGRGIVHSEMPQQEDGLMWGFQLWVNLPSKLKMTAPRYQDIPPEDVPEIEIDGGRIRIVAGESGGTRGPVEAAGTAPTYLDLHLRGDSRHTQRIPDGHNGFIYVYEGAGTVGNTGVSDGASIEAGTLAVLGDGDAVQTASGPDGMKCLIVAARPIGEPIARYGPFVMTTRAELEQAFEDYRNGTFLD